MNKRETDTKTIVKQINRLIEALSPFAEAIERVLEEGLELNDDMIAHYFVDTNDFIEAYNVLNETNIPKVEKEL